MIDDAMTSDRISSHAPTPLAPRAGEDYHNQIKDLQGGDEQCAHHTLNKGGGEEQDSVAGPVGLRTRSARTGSRRDEEVTLLTKHSSIRRRGCFRPGGLVALSERTTGRLYPALDCPHTLIKLG
jgi:hypothetical protein